MSAGLSATEWGSNRAFAADELTVHLTWRTAPVVSVPLDREPLDLAQTLQCGQAFRWRRVADQALGGDTWEGVVAARVWRVARVGDVLRVQMLPSLAGDDIAAEVKRYFSLDVPAREVQQHVSAAHPLAAEAVARQAGLRLLRQDPVETFLTFAIANATNVPRVTRSVDLLCRRYGSPIAVIDGSPHHAFPSPEALLAAAYDDLFGPCNLAFRARHLKEFAAALLRNDGVVSATMASTPLHPRRDAARSLWLDLLATRHYREAHAELDALPYCGPKVADCICLFGLGFGEAVPVDVHVWAIAHDLFGAKIPTRTLTATTYQRIGDLYRELFGAYAGWAQQYLYAARRATPPRDRSRPGRP